MLTEEGAREYFHFMFRSSLVTYYVGLCGNIAANNFPATLADITDEPSTVNGYARIALPADIPNWPTMTLINNMIRINSIDIQFNATSGDFDKPITRYFLCNVATGTVGKLFSFSGALPEPLVIVPGTPFLMRAEQWMGQ